MYDPYKYKKNNKFVRKLFDYNGSSKLVSYLNKNLLVSYIHIGILLKYLV